MVYCVSIIIFLKFNSNKILDRIGYYLTLGKLFSRFIDNFIIDNSLLHVEKYNNYLLTEELDSNKDSLLNMGLWINENIIKVIFYDRFQIHEQNIINQFTRETVSNIYIETVSNISNIDKNNVLSKGKEKHVLSSSSPIGPIVVKPKLWKANNSDNIVNNRTGGSGLSALGIKNKNGMELHCQKDSRYWNGFNLVQQTEYELNKPMYDYLILNKDKLLASFDKDKKENLIRSLTSIGEYVKFASFYMNMNIDARSRSNIKINYINDKLVRSLIRFKKKTYVSKEGIKLLKVALVTYYYGNSKISTNTSLKLFNDELVKKIKLFYNKKMDCDFWLKADSPFLFLSAMFEFINIQTISNYKSAYILYKDATMSCIQNFSGFLNNKEFQKEVNLIYQDNDSIPGDLYISIIRRFLLKHELPSELITYKSDLKLLRGIFKRPIWR